METDCFARSRVLQDQSITYQKLSDHLFGVARIAAGSAEKFRSGEWGRIAGIWHDVGKYHPDFQKRLRGENVRFDHSGPGAVLAKRMSSTNEWIYFIAFAIAGHHTGLADPVNNEPGLPTALKERLQKNEVFFKQVEKNVHVEIASCKLPDLPIFLSAEVESGKDNNLFLRRMEFWIRFLFSTLVDADRLDAERFDDQRISDARKKFPSISDLYRVHEDYMNSLVNSLSEESRSMPVNKIRADVLSLCRKAAEKPRGIFAMTVPTGGGKTLSSMSFALRHADRHGMDRVIVVIPYTSIIEQNAMVFRKSVGAENVVEHHSSFDVARLGADVDPVFTERHELACDNWDAPVIVTTTVQFFESLFSNRPSKCRKLHNISNSVIILDEVQSLPVGFIDGILDALKELTLNYGCSVVLSTATPPALKKRESLKEGFTDIRDLIPDTAGLSHKLQRVRYHWPGANEKISGWEKLAGKLAGHERVLAIVHKRTDARELCEELKKLLPEERIFHLSALMCPKHRIEVIGHIRQSLDGDGTCRVISTQLVEAGVDLDFPVVFRTLGGLDSIVQAAGRCNREGRLDTGEVFIFRSPSTPPPGTPRKALETTESMLNKYKGMINTSDPAIFDEYFRILYSKENHDLKKIQTNRENFNFATVGRDFRLIEDGFTHPVIVPYGESPGLVALLREHGPNSAIYRKLQLYTVNIYENTFRKLSRESVLEEVEGIQAIGDQSAHFYSDVFGLVVDGGEGADPQKLIF